MGVCLGLGVCLAGAVTLFLPAHYRAEARVSIEDTSRSGGLMASLANLPAGIGGLVLFATKRRVFGAPVPVPKTKRTPGLSWLSAVLLRCCLDECVRNGARFGLLGHLQWPIRAM